MEKVEETIYELKEGTLTMGPFQKVASGKQAFTIGLSEARNEGKEVQKASFKKDVPKKTAKKSSSKSSIFKNSEEEIFILVRISIHPNFYIFSLYPML